MEKEKVDIRVFKSINSGGTLFYELKFSKHGESIFHESIEALVKKLVESIDEFQSVTGGYTIELRPYHDIELYNIPRLCLPLNEDESKKLWTEYCK